PIESAIIELLGKPAPELLAGLPMPGPEAIGAPLANLYPWLASVTVLSSPEAPPSPDGTPAPATVLVPEMTMREVAMTIAKGGDRAEAIFPLHRGETAYRIHVKDEFKFKNSDPPRRTIRIENEEPPVVALLPERFPEEGRASTEDDDVEGVPVIYKGKF